MSQAMNRGQFTGLFGRTSSMRIGTLPEVSLCAQSKNKNAPGGGGGGANSGETNLTLAGNLFILS